jgi:hypothetical protein
MPHFQHILKGVLSQSRGYEPETLNYKIRVEADGGVINNIDLLNNDVKYLKSISALSDFSSILLCYGGMKLRVAGDSFVTKWYDLTTNNNDAVQTEELEQPKYNINSINSIPVITTLNSSMLVPEILARTYIDLVSGAGDVSTTRLHGRDAGNFITNRRGRILYRSTAPQPEFLWGGAFATDLRIDTLTISLSNNIIASRNANEHPDGEKLTGGVFSATSIFSQGTNRFNGLIAAMFKGNVALEFQKKNAIENYYKIKFGIL